MDQIFKSKNRKWISKRYKLGNRMKKLRKWRMRLYQRFIPEILSGEIESVKEDARNAEKDAVQRVYFEEKVENAFAAIELVGGPSFFKVEPEPKPKLKRGRKRKNPLPEPEPERIAEETEIAQIEEENNSNEPEVIDVELEPPPKKPFENYMQRVVELKDEEAKTLAEKDKSSIMKLVGEYIKDYDYDQIEKSVCTNQATVFGEACRDKPIVSGQEMPVMVPPVQNPKDLNLKGVSVFMCYSEDPLGIHWKTNSVQEHLNDFVNREAFIERQLAISDCQDPSLLISPEEDFIIEASVYQPRSLNEDIPFEVKSPSDPKLAYRVQLLGRNTVKELKSVLMCQTDFMCHEEVEIPTDELRKELQFQIPKSGKGMIFIGETAFLDESDPEMLDIIRRLNEWSSRNPKKYVREIHTSSFDVALESLSLRFGFPYVYVHRGSCEHIFVFNKARLIAPSDEMRRAKFPLIGPHEYKPLICRVDNDNVASWAVVGYKSFPDHTMVVCTDCLKQYCYRTVKRKLVKQGEFRLYPLVQIANVL